LSARYKSWLLRQNIYTDVKLSATGCSLNIVFFPKNSRKFATSPSPALGCYWLYKKLPANWSDCTLALRWELWRSFTAMKAREWLQRNLKKHNFSWTPCIYTSNSQPITSTFHWFSFFIYIQGVHYILCFFSKILKYSLLFPSSLFPRCQCVYTHQAGRTPALQQNW